jgi:uncharacterized UPF0160 family protein
VSALQRARTVETLSFSRVLSSLYRWRVQAVTVEGKSFENRLSLPDSWRGLRDEALVAVTNIPGCRFVHAAGFIGGNDSYEGALEMARAALNWSSR